MDFRCAQQPRQLSFLYARLVIIPTKASRYQGSAIQLLVSAFIALHRRVLRRIWQKSGLNPRDTHARAGTIEWPHPGIPLMGHLPTRSTPLGIVASGKGGQGWRASNSPPSVSLLLCQRYSRMARNRAINPAAGIHVHQIRGRWAYAKSRPITRA